MEAQLRNSSLNRIYRNEIHELKEVKLTQIFRHFLLQDFPLVVVIFSLITLKNSSAKNNFYPGSVHQVVKNRFNADEILIKMSMMNVEKVTNICLKLLKTLHYG